MTPLFRSLALCAASVAMTTAQATPVTLVSTGTINYGYDFAGEFGAANRALDGRTVSITYRFDSSAYATPGNPYAYNYGATAAGTQTVAIDGISRQYAFDATNSYLYSYFVNNLSTNGQI